MSTLPVQERFMAKRKKIAPQQTSTDATIIAVCHTLGNLAMARHVSTVNTTVAKNNTMCDVLPNVMLSLRNCDVVGGFLHHAVFLERDSQRVGANTTVVGLLPTTDVGIDDDCANSCAVVVVLQKHSTAGV